MYILCKHKTKMLTSHVIFNVLILLSYGCHLLPRILADQPIINKSDTVPHKENTRTSIRSTNSSNLVHESSVPHNSSSDAASTKKSLHQIHVSSLLLLTTPTTISKHNASNAEQEIVVNTSFQKINSGALLRGFYVFVGLSVIVVMYLVVRSVRLRRKVNRVHKYGILANREDVEMTPLGAEDEDDDNVVFDLSNHPPS